MFVYYGAHVKSVDDIFQTGSPLHKYFSAFWRGCAPSLTPRR